MYVKLCFYSANWKNIEYNYGNEFDGTTFTAPVPGLYSFSITAKQKSYQYGYVRCCVNNIDVAYRCLSNCNNDLGPGMNAGPISINTTLRLKKSDKVYINVGGHLFNLYDSKVTYFEGRLVSVINE